MTNFEDSETAPQTEALSFNDSRILDSDFKAKPFASPPLDPLELIGLSADELHRKVADEVTMLDMLSREGQLRIRTRLLILFAEMAKRFADGLSYEGLTRQRGMAAYLRTVGCDPGKLRVWKFLMRKEEIARLAGEPSAPIEAGDGIVGTDVSNGVEQGVPSQELEPVDVAVSAPVPFEGGGGCDLPAADFNPAYFEAALNCVAQWCSSTPAGAPVHYIFTLLQDREEVLSHALQLKKVAFSLQTVAEQANQLAEAMTNALNVLPDSEF